MTPSSTARGGGSGPSIPTDAEVEQAFDVLRRHYEAQRAQQRPASAPVFIFTAEPASLASVGYTRRSIEAPILRGELAAAKVTRGYRVALEDLRAWEQRPRVRPGRPRRIDRDDKPENDHQAPAAPRGLRAVPSVDEDDELLARAVAAGGGRRR